jgi:hypothetical protein
MDKVRDHNVGSSDYSKFKIQPWDIILEHNLNYWDGDIVKRILRTKEGDSRKMDYEKIIHICQERIRQIDDKQPIRVTGTMHDREPLTPEQQIRFGAEGFPTTTNIEYTPEGIPREGCSGALILDKSDVAKEEEELIWHEVVDDIPVDLKDFLSSKGALEKFVKNYLSWDSDSKNIRTISGAFVWDDYNEDEYWSDLNAEFHAIEIPKTIAYPEFEEQCFIYNANRGNVTGANFSKSREISKGSCSGCVFSKKGECCSEDDTTITECEKEGIIYVKN